MKPVNVADVQLLDPISQATLTTMIQKLAISCQKDIDDYFLALLIRQAEVVGGITASLEHLINAQSMTTQALIDMEKEIRKLEQQIKCLIN